MFCPALVLAACLTALPHLGAQPVTVAQDLKRLSFEQLANLEVTTATKQPEQVIDTAAAVFVITSEDIRRSGATTLPDVLRLAPGVTVARSDANRWAVGVRGFADIFSRNVLVLIDGRSLYTPLVGGVHWAIQDVVLADIDRIEVIRGPGASVWGANAVNGVINVITRRAQATQGLRLTAAAGNVERGRVAARYGGSVGGGAYRVYGKAFNRAPQFHPDGSDFDDWHSVQGGFRFDRTAGANTFTISGDAYRTDVGERADVSRYDPPSISTVDGRIDLTGGNVIAAWHHAFTGGSRLRVQAFFDRTSRQGFTFGETRTTWDVDVNGRLAPRGRHRFAAGVNARVSPSTVTQVVPTLTFAPNEHTFRVMSGFVTDDIGLLAGRLTVTPGVKIEYNSYTGTELLPSIQALWRPASSRRLWGAITRAVRTPSRFERDLDFRVLVNPALPLYLAVRGSQAFDSERVDGTEIGYRQLLSDNLYVDVTAFTNRYDGLSSFGDLTTGFVTTPIPHVEAATSFVNGVDGTSRGFEVAPDWKPLANWRLSGSYSYLRLSLQHRPGVTSTGSVEPYVGGSPRHHARVQSRLDLGGRLSVDQSYRYVSRRAAGDVPGYHEVDARLAWQLTPRHEVSVVGQNLLDPHHPELRAVPVEIRRSVYVQLTLTPGR